MAKACSLEASKMEASGMERKLPTEEANLISQKQQSKASRLMNKPTPPNNKTCQQCGLTWPHNAKPCPAKGQVCHKCGKQNHFARMCLTKVPQQQGQQSHVNQVTSDPDSSSDDEYLYVLSQDTHGSKIPRMSVMINEIPVDMIIDTGASIDILDETAYHKFNYSRKITLKPSTKQLFAYGSKSQLHVIGSFEATVTFRSNRTVSTLHVLQGSHGSLLSYSTAVALGILDIQLHHISSTPICEQLFRQYTSLFEGISKLKGIKVQLHIDTKVTPVAQKARQIPFHLRKKVEHELKVLEEQHIIERVDGPTPWVSPLILIPKKNGAVRICVDMRRANKAITRERTLLLP